MEPPERFVERAGKASILEVCTSMKESLEVNEGQEFFLVASRPALLRNEKPYPSSLTCA